MMKLNLIFIWVVGKKQDLTLFILGSHFDQPVHNYSSGMRARVGFSVAVYVNPDVILLDEVLGVGDENFRLKSSKTIRKKIKSDKTVVLVSHQKGLVLNICDRVLWVDEGKIIEQGEAQKVVESYYEKTGRV